MSSDEEERLQRRISAVDDDSEDGDELEDADSGAGSDDFDLLELAETGAEFCKVGNVTCNIPLELYDLPGLEDILSREVWNEYLTEEERLSLSKYLPDMDQHTFMHTLRELFEGSYFHFGSPVKKLFDMLKGGQCEPRNALYLEGRNLFQKNKHYHLLRKYHNDIVFNLCQIRDAWTNFKGYSIDEKLRVLNIMKTQKNMMYEKMEDLGADSSEKDEPFDGLWNRRLKENKSAQNKLARHSVDLRFELSSQGQHMSLEQAKYGKQNSKGILKTGSSKFPSAKESLGRFASIYNGLDVSSGPCPSPLHRHKYDSMRMDDDIEDPLFGTRSRRDRDVDRVSFVEETMLSRIGKKHKLLRDEEPVSGRLRSMPYASKPPNIRSSYDFVRTSKYAKNLQPHTFGDQMISLKGESLQLPLKGSLGDLSDSVELYRHGKTRGDSFSVNPSFISNDRNGKHKKWKAGKESPDISLKSYRATPQQMNDRFLNTEFGGNILQEKIRVSLASRGVPERGALRGSRLFMRGDDTESDSSEQYGDDEDNTPIMWNKLAYSGVGVDSSRLSLLDSGRDAKKGKSSKKDMHEIDWVVDGRSAYSKNMGTLVEHAYMQGAENYLLKAKQKGKLHENSPLNNFASRDLEDSPISGLGKFKDDDDRKQIFRPSKRKRKGFDEDDDLLEIKSLVDENRRGRLERKGQIIEEHVNDGGERSEARLMSCSKVSKKKKVKEVLMVMEKRDEKVNLQFDPIDISSKKKEKKKLEVDNGFPDLGTPETPKEEMGTTDLEMETKPQKKPFTLIIPTVHTGFSFSIIHLLSAVRMTMISACIEDALEVGKPREERSGEHEGEENGVPISEDADTSKLNLPEQGNLPSLSLQEIVNRVRSNPGDPCILETQEPLQDLVRGVLKIFSSKTSPLGAKGWKALVAYEKSTKSWSWIVPVPVPYSSTDHETSEEITSPEAWGLPHKMLVKLVDSFANWLKNGQETLQQIGSLPAPPLSLMQCNLDEKERFKELRAQKSLTTITLSSDEVRCYFRKEEVLRYSIPDRAFAYTAADGKKSIVAPLRRGGGKPTSKAREHFMLEKARPPHVTILCLVRDAAARLPGSIGTRADICTLIRDSQYIVEDVTDAQVNQVVSGALDRLHYERDPCVQFDAERKLWVYLHRDREEEDFEDDGTSSTKKWKRPKKEAAEQSDQGAVTVAFLGNGDQSGFDLISDLNAEPTCTEEDKGTDNAEDNGDNDTHEDQTMVWDAVGENPGQENNFICQENSANDDFEDET